MPNDNLARRDQGGTLASGGYPAAGSRFGEASDGSSDLQASMYHRERSRLQVEAHHNQHTRSVTVCSWHCFVEQKGRLVSASISE